MQSTHPVTARRVGQRRSHRVSSHLTEQFYKMMKIAVFIDEKGNAVPFGSIGTVHLYVHEENNWYCIKKIPLGADEGMSLSDIQARVFAVVSEMGDCKVFAAEAIKGVPLAIFGGMGINLWKIKGVVAEVLNTIEEQMSKMEADQLKSSCSKQQCQHSCSTNTDESIPVPSPVAVGTNGMYEIDLAMALKSEGSFNSRQILLPFFQHTTFQKLEMTCDHLPKWFDGELGKFKLQFQQEFTEEGLCHVTVYPKC